MTYHYNVYEKEDGELMGQRFEGMILHTIISQIVKY